RTRTPLWPVVRANQYQRVKSRLGIVANDIEQGSQLLVHHIEHFQIVVMLAGSLLFPSRWKEGRVHVVRPKVEIKGLTAVLGASDEADSSIHIPGRNVIALFPKNGPLPEEVRAK